MNTLSSINLTAELGDLLSDENLLASSVLLIPPQIPLTCFPGLLKELLSKILAREWTQLSDKAQMYLQWISVKAESIDVLVPEDLENSTKGFELLAIDREGRSFGAILEQCRQLGIPSVLIRFATLIAALITIRLLRRQPGISLEQLKALMFTQNVDAEYLNYPLALKSLMQLFPEYQQMCYFEVNEYLTKDYLSTIRALANDLGIRLVLDDSNKMDMVVHWELLDLADWIKLDFQATATIEKILAAGEGPSIIWHFEQYAAGAGSPVIVFEGLSEDSPLKLYLKENWKHKETVLYYQSRERRPLPPWDQHFGLLQDYCEGEYGLFFKGLITQAPSLQRD